MQCAEPMLPSAIKWVGGKSKLRRRIIERLPDSTECYCEVFAGAAWVLFGKKSHPVEVINDRNDDLVNLWRVIKWRTAEFMEEIQHYLYSRTMFNDLKMSEPISELDKAVTMYLMIQMAFGGEISSTQKASFGYRKKSRGDFFLSKAEDDLLRVKRRMSHVFVENLDFYDCINRYDQPNSIFFCDPPYLDTFGYSIQFGLDDHIRLRDTLSKIKGKFLMTINDHPTIRTMYQSFHIEADVEARSISLTVEGRRPDPILFISNYVPEIEKNAVSLFEEEWRSE